MRDAAINLRAKPEQRDLIDQAAAVLGKNRSDFMLEAACDRAQAVLLDQVHFRLEAGCNTFSGGFSQTSDRLTFTPLAMTRMACAEGQLTENKYAVLLTGARTYRWTARSLELLDGTTALARFERM